MSASSSSASYVSTSLTIVHFERPRSVESTAGSGAQTHDAPRRVESGRFGRRSLKTGMSARSRRISRDEGSHAAGRNHSESTQTSSDNDAAVAVAVAKATSNKLNTNGSNDSRSDDGSYHSIFVRRVMSQAPDCTPAERANLAFFMRTCRNTLECASTTDVDYFCRVLPQVSHRMPSVRAALVCFSSYIQSLVDPSAHRVRDHRMFAEYQYGKLLKLAASVGASGSKNSVSKSTSMSSPDWIEVFLVALLLRCIETYRHDYTRAATHLAGSARIVMEIGRARVESLRSRSLESCLQQLVSRVDGKIRLVASSEDEFATGSPMSPLADFNVVVAGICKDVRWARVTEGERVGGEGDGDGDDYSALFISVVHSCIERLDQYFISTTTSTASTLMMQPDDKNCGQSTLVYLQIQYEICRLVLLKLAHSHSLRHHHHQPPPPPPPLPPVSPLPHTSSDATPTDPHAHLLTLIHQFSDLQHPRGTKTDNSPNPTPSQPLDSQGRPVYVGFGIELIPSVMFVATECQSDNDKETHRSAIRFLRQAFRQEWLWDSLNAARVAEWIGPRDGTSRSGQGKGTGEEHGEGEGKYSDHISSDSSPHQHIETHHPISVSFYRRNDDLGARFGRATWIELREQRRRDGRVSKHWLNTDDASPSHGKQDGYYDDYNDYGWENDKNNQDSRRDGEDLHWSPIPPTPLPLPLPPSDLRLCYTTHGPFWPSAAQAIWRAGTGDKAGAGTGMGIRAGR